MARLKEDVRRLRFWRSIIAEFLGSMFIVLVGCAAFTETEGIQRDHRNVVKIALAFGLTYAAFLYCVRNLTEAHLNPAVTVAMLATRRSSLIRSALYLACQFLGALLGAALVFAFTASDYLVTPGRGGCTVPADHVTEGHAFGVEFFAAFLFVFVVFSCYDKAKRDELQQPATPFVVGFTYSAVILFALPYTGGSVNTARSFGPALVNGVWKAHWVYWFGPLIGGVCGGALYDVIFSTKASFDRIRACIFVFHKKEEPEKPEAAEVALKQRDLELGVAADEPGEERKDAAAPTDELEELGETKPVPGSAEHKPRLKLFRPKFSCCNKDTAHQ